MQRLEVSGAVRPLYGSSGVKRLMFGCQWKCVGTSQDEGKSFSSERS